MSGKNLKPTDAWLWIVQGWAMFVRNPAIWLAMTLVYVIAVFMLNMIPAVGPLAASLLSPLFLAGFLHASREIDRDHELNVAQLFYVLQDSTLTTKMLMLGLIPMVLSLLSAALIRLGASADIVSIVVMAIAFVAGLAMLYALPLVVFENREPMRALTQSLGICLRHLPAVVVFLALALAFAILAAIPFGMGLVVYVPVMVCAVYRSYLQVAANS